MHCLTHLTLIKSQTVILLRTSQTSPQGPLWLISQDRVTRYKELPCGATEMSLLCSRKITCSNSDEATAKDGVKFGRYGILLHYALSQRHKLIVDILVLCNEEERRSCIPLSVMMLSSYNFSKEAVIKFGEENAINYSIINKNSNIVIKIHNLFTIDKTIYFKTNRLWFCKALCV